MAIKGRHLELNCLICSQPLTSCKVTLSDEVLAIIAEQNILRKTKTDHEYNRYIDVENEQVVATKCGHMFHMGCLRSHIKAGLEGKGTAFCPICTKPVALTRIWPVLIPPTPHQSDRIKKMKTMKEQNALMREEILELREKINNSEKEFLEVEKELNECLGDIQRKQKQLDGLNGPTDEELQELRKIQRNRQTIVKVVTKHNGELLDLLMHETNVNFSDLELPDFEDSNNNISVLDKPRKSCAKCNKRRSHHHHRSHSDESAVPFGNPSESCQILNDASTVSFSEGNSQSPSELDVNTLCWKQKQAEIFCISKFPEKGIGKSTKTNKKKGNKNKEFKTTAAPLRIDGLSHFLSTKVADGNCNKASNLNKKRPPIGPPSKMKPKPKWC